MSFEKFPNLLDMFLHLCEKEKGCKDLKYFTQMLQISPTEGEWSRPTDIRGGSCLGTGSAKLLKRSMLRLITPSLPGLVESDLSPIYSTDLNGLSLPELLSTTTKYGDFSFSLHDVLQQLILLCQNPSNLVSK